MLLKTSVWSENRATLINLTQCFIHKSMFWHILLQNKKTLQLNDQLGQNGDQHNDGIYVFSKAMVKVKSTFCPNGLDA